MKWRKCPISGKKREQAGKRGFRAKMGVFGVIEWAKIYKSKMAQNTGIA